MANFANPSQALLDAEHTFNLFDDFTWFVTAHQWVSTVTDGGSIAVASGAAGSVGVIQLTNDTAADNDEIYVGSTLTFTLAANKNLYGECKLQFSEANTDDANVAFGFASSVGADLILDNGGGMRASGTILAIFKVDGGSAWQCVSRNGSTVFTNTSSTTAGGSAFQTLGIEVVELLSTTCTVVFKVNGEILRDATTNQPIRHQLPYSGATAMQVFVGQKNGSANNELTSVDYIGVVQHK